MDEELNTKKFFILKYDISSQSYYFVNNSITYTLQIDQDTGDISFI
jgi:hypothetical protein